MSRIPRNRDEGLVAIPKTDQLQLWINRPRREGPNFGIPRRGEPCVKNFAVVSQNSPVRCDHFHCSLSNADVRHCLCVLNGLPDGRGSTADHITTESGIKSHT